MQSEEFDITIMFSCFLAASCRISKEIFQLINFIIMWFCVISVELKLIFPFLVCFGFELCLEKVNIVFSLR